MPFSLNLCRLLRRATVAISLCTFAALQHFAAAQTVAPEFDPFGADDPFATSNSSIKRPVVELGTQKKLLSSASSKTHSPNSKPLPPLRVYQLGESKPGGPIASIPSDPYMTAEQEARIFAALRVHDDSDWDSISLIELKRLLKDRLPIWIDRSELSIVNVDANSAIENAGEVVAGPIGDRLTCLFKDKQVGFSIRANRLEITSTDDLNSTATIRIYDVTPLVLRNRGGKRVFDFETLSKLIQSTIESDSWLSAGGTNVISDFIVGEPGAERSLIVVSAPTATQMRLQTMLDRLNLKQARD